MRRRRAAAAAAAAALAVSLAAAAPVAARSVQVVSYPAADVWSTAVRFLRVDRGYAIKEKDEAAGYLLFEHTDAGKTHRGALELIPGADAEGRAATQLVMSLPELPRHYETALLDRLAAKLRDERGPPAPPPPRRRPPAAVDGGRPAPSSPSPADGGLPRAPGASP